MKNYFDLLKKHLNAIEILKLVLMFITGALFVCMITRHDIFELGGSIIIFCMFVWLDIAALTNFELLDGLEDED